MENNFQLPEVSEIHSMAIAGSDLFVSDSFNHKVLRLDVRTGTQKPWPQMELQYPTGMTCSGDHLFLCDSWNHRLLALDREGRELAGTGCFGMDDAALDSPEACALAPDGMLWVADLGNDRIKIYNTQLELQRIIPGGNLLGSTSMQLGESVVVLLAPKGFYPRRLAFCGDLWAVQGNAWLCVFAYDALILSWYSMEWGSYQLIGLYDNKPLLLHQDGHVELLDPDHADPYILEGISGIKTGTLEHGKLVLYGEKKRIEINLDQATLTPGRPFALLTRNDNKTETVDKTTLFPSMSNSALVMMDACEPVLTAFESIDFKQIHCGLDPYSDITLEYQLVADYIFSGEARIHHYHFCHAVFACLSLHRQASLLMEHDDTLKAKAFGTWVEHILKLTGRLLKHRYACLQRNTSRAPEKQRRLNWVLFHYHRILLLFTDLINHFMEVCPSKSGETCFGIRQPLTAIRLELMAYERGYAGERVAESPETWKKRATTAFDSVSLVAEKYKTGLSTEDHYHQLLKNQARELRERFRSKTQYVQDHPKYLALFYYLIGWKKELDQLVHRCSVDRVAFLENASVMVRLVGWLGRLQDLEPYEAILKGDIHIPDRGYSMMPFMIYNTAVAMAEANATQGHLEKSFRYLAHLPEELKPYFESMVLYQAFDERALEKSQVDSAMGPNHLVRCLSLLRRGLLNETMAAANDLEQSSSGIWSEFVRGIALRAGGYYDKAELIFNSFGNRICSGNLQKGILFRMKGNFDRAHACFEKEALRLPHWLVSLHQAMTFKREGMNMAAQSHLETLPDYAIVFWDGKPIKRGHAEFENVLDWYLELEQQNLKAVTHPDSVMLPYASYLRFICFAACRSLTYDSHPFMDMDEAPSGELYGRDMLRCKI